MTVTSSAPPLAARSVPAAVGALRARGMRVSTARRLLLEALFAGTGPMTAEAIAAGLDGRLPPSDLASVYRNLDMLTELGLIRHFHLGHGPGLYRLAGRKELELVACERCGEFEAVEPERLDAIRAAIERELGYRARFSHFPLVGVCVDCRAEGSSA